MNAWLPGVWLFALAAPPVAHAQGTDWRVATCRTGSRLDVYSEVSQDEGGLKCWVTRFSSLARRTPKVEVLSQECLGSLPSMDGGLRSPALDAQGEIDWGDPTCRPLQRVVPRLDARVVPARPTPAQLESLDGSGLRLRTSEFWREPLHRRVEVRADGGVVGAFSVELQAPEVFLEGFDVGDGRHLLLAAHWTFAHHEGAPVGDLQVQLVPLDGARLPTARADAGPQVLLAYTALPPSARWNELARWEAAVATGLEARRSSLAKDARALAVRRARQAELVVGRQFSSVLHACDTYGSASADRLNQAALMDAVTALHAATRAVDWPLVVEALDWNWSTCGDLMRAQADGGSWVDDFVRPR